MICFAVRSCRSWILKFHFAVGSYRSWILRFCFAVGSCGSWILFFGHGTSLPLTDAKWGWGDRSPPLYVRCRCTCQLSPRSTQDPPIVPLPPLGRARKWIHDPRGATPPVMRFRTSRTPVRRPPSAAMAASVRPRPVTGTAATAPRPRCDRERHHCHRGRPRCDRERHHCHRGRPRCDRERRRCHRGRPRCDRERRRCHRGRPRCDRAPLPPRPSQVWLGEAPLPPRPSQVWPGEAPLPPRPSQVWPGAGRRPARRYRSFTRSHTFRRRPAGRAWRRPSHLMSQRQRRVAQAASGGPWAMRTHLAQKTFSKITPEDVGKEWGVQCWWLWWEDGDATYGCYMVLITCG